MAGIAPFGALRFTAGAGKIDQLVCPPYDIISDEQRKVYLETNEHNIIRLELPREGEDPYAQAGETLHRWLSEGVLASDEKPALYIYEEEFTHRGERMKFSGIICRVHLEEFSKGIVLPHEETLSKAKTDRLNLMRATGCNFSQIYSLYNDEGGVTAGRLAVCREAAPQVELTDGEGVTHRLWVVTDDAVIQAVVADFAPRKLYIADGHHRYETALNYRNECREKGLSAEGDACDSVMMMLVDMENPGLVVYPTHRIVRDLPSFDREAVLTACAEYFDIQQGVALSEVSARLDSAYEAGKKAFALVAGDTADLLVLRDISVMESLLPEASEALRGLDVSVLHSLVLERIFGIDKANMANQLNLTYTRVTEEAIQAVKEGRANCCFLLNPTRVSEIRDVAAAGEKMPQKSTYFYPKLITGLVMNRF